MNPIGGMRLVQKGLKARHTSNREKLYMAAVAALYKDARSGTKSARDDNYRDTMTAVYTKYPDDETKLFYWFSILGAIPEGSKGFERQGQAAKLFEQVYAHQPDHPGVLHYLIHKCKYRMNGISRPHTFDYLRIVSVPLTLSILARS